MKQYILLFSITFLIIFNIKIHSQPSASFYFTTAFPVGEFKDFNQNTGFGGNLEFFFFSPNEKIPYGLGLELGYISYGLHLATDPYSSELLLSANKANNFASARLIFQVSPPSGTIRPYFETLFGGNYIFSQTTFEHYDYSISTLWIDDWAWSYGAGVGIKFLSIGDPFFSHGSLFVDLKVRYMFGTPATYLDRESVVLYGDVVEYSLTETKTDVISASIGLYFFF